MNLLFVQKSHVNSGDKRNKCYLTGIGKQFTVLSFDNPGEEITVNNVDVTGFSNGYENETFKYTMEVRYSPTLDGACSENDYQSKTYTSGYLKNNEKFRFQISPDKYWYKVFITAENSAGVKSPSYAFIFIGRMIN